MRKYSVGDSSSQINRKLSAKYQELYTNIFPKRENRSRWILLDINYNRRGWDIWIGSKLAYSEDIVSYCQHQQIGIRFFSPKSTFWWSTKLKENVMKKNTEEIFTALHEIFAWVKKTKKIYQSLLHAFLEEAVKEKTKRAIVIFSDFLTMDEEAKKLLHYLKKQHILFLFQLPIDPEQGQKLCSKFFLKNCFKQMKQRNRIIAGGLDYFLSTYLFKKNSVVSSISRLFISRTLIHFTSPIFGSLGFNSPPIVLQT